MNSCSSFKGLYTARHDRLVELIAAQIPCMADEQIFKHTTAQSKWFNSPANTFLGIANTPDIVNISQNGKKVTLFEVSCAFDLFMEDSYCSKILKYQSLISTVENLGYKCQFIVLVFGSLGHVHRLVVRGLCIGGLSKGQTVGKVLFNLSNYRKHVYLEKAMFPIPLEL